jgi:hypothetical protein
MLAVVSGDGFGGRISDGSAPKIKPSSSGGGRRPEELKAYGTKAETARERTNMTMKNEE